MVIHSILGTLKQKCLCMVPFLPQFLGTCLEMANASLKFPKFGGSCTLAI